MILDLFAGPGGWSEGLRMLGLADIGIEWDDAACRTRRAAGHLTLRADVAKYPTAPFVGKVTGLIASPPCQDFSLAGKRAGRTGEKGQLIDEVPRWVDELRPEWVALEQVPPALEVWEEFALLFRSWGYSVWCGILNAADFGVPQTRRRAILVASRVAAALPPEPTHAKNPEPGLFGESLPWVSMAQALGWDDQYLVGFPRRADTPSNRTTGTVTLGDTDYRERDLYPSDGPAQVVTEKARSWQRWVVRTGANSMVTGRSGSKAGDGDVQPYERPITEPAPTLDAKVGGAWTVLNPGRTETQPNRRLYGLDEPAPTVAFGHDAASWCWERPATAVCADPRLSPPGYRGRPDDYDEDGTYTGERSMDNAIKLTVAEALTLQSFDPDYPVQGTKTKQFEQVGNAVPPLLAMHIIRALTAAKAQEVAA